MEEEIFEPASPSSQYLNSSNLSLSVIAVLESKVPIEYEDSLPINLLKDVFVPINPRFSSIMVSSLLPFYIYDKVVFLFLCQLMI